MSQATAQLNYLRIAPRKVRLVADLIRGKNLQEAKNILRFTQKKAARPLLKLIASAAANAEHDSEIKQEDFYIAEILVNEGPTLKRWRPRARGRATEIKKRTSHIKVVLSEGEAQPKPEL